MEENTLSLDELITLTLREMAREANTQQPPPARSLSALINELKEKGYLNG